jgi:hypothetical protein
LSRVGFDNVVGHLDGGFEEKRAKETDTVNRITANFCKRSQIGESKVIDVQRK